MTIDAVLRHALLILLVLVFAYGLIGGLMSRVSGAWRDGERLITLRQLGPFVHGHAARNGGWERYSGTVLWGRLRLRRYDGGLHHLEGLGFAPEVAPLLENQLMATFDLRLKGSVLEGVFEGRVIRSERQPPRILSVTRTKPKARVWSRA